MTIRFLLPTRLFHPGNIAFIGEFAKTNPAEFEFAVDGMRTTAPFAAGVTADGKLRCPRVADFN